VIDEDDPNRCFQVVSIHPGPKVVGNPAVMQQCWNDADWILLACFPLSILALIDKTFAQIGCAVGDELSCFFYQTITSLIYFKKKIRWQVM